MKTRGLFRRRICFRSVLSCQNPLNRYIGQNISFLQKIKFFSFFPIGPHIGKGQIAIATPTLQLAQHAFGGTFAVVSACALLCADFFLRIQGRASDHKQWGKTNKNLRTRRTHSEKHTYKKVWGILGGLENDRRECALLLARVSPELVTGNAQKSTVHDFLHFGEGTFITEYLQNGSRISQKLGSRLRRPPASLFFGK